MTPPLFGVVGLSVAFNADEQARGTATTTVDSPDLRELVPVLEASVCAERVVYAAIFERISICCPTVQLVVNERSTFGSPIVYGPPLLAWLPRSNEVCW